MLTFASVLKVRSSSCGLQWNHYNVVDLYWLTHLIASVLGVFSNFLPSSQVLKRWDVCPLYVTGRHWGWRTVWKMLWQPSRISHCPDKNGEKCCLTSPWVTLGIQFLSNAFHFTSQKLIVSRSQYCDGFSPSAAWLSCRTIKYPMKCWHLVSQKSYSLLWSFHKDSK